ncbi:MAG: ABC transporter substrate-binding protein [Acidimicrobiales bacterium]
MNSRHRSGPVTALESPAGHRPSRRSLAVVLVAAIVLAGCSGASEPPRVAPTTARIAAPADPWPGETLQTTSTPFVFPLNFNVFETLVSLGPDYSLRPGLADRWEPRPDNKGWRFHLRRDVKFHDGRPFTAADVLWTWQLQSESRRLSSVLNTLGPGSVVQIDEFTVDFVPAVANQRLPEQLAHPQGAIVAADTTFSSSPPVGTGPYRVTGYREGISATFERFDGYRGRAAPMARLEVKFMPDPAERADALLNGSADVAMDLTPGDAKRVDGSDRASIIRSTPGRTHLLYINKAGVASHDLGSDAAVRRAITLGLDRQAYVRAVLGGDGEPGRWMAPRAVLGSAAEDVRPVAFDPDGARRALDEGGWVPGPDGVRVRGDRRLALSLIGWADIELSAFDLIVAQLRALGIEVAARPVLEQSTFRSFYASNEFVLDLEAPTQNDANPALLPISRLYSRYEGTDRFSPGGELDNLAEESLAATDPEVVRARAARMMDLAISDVNVVVPLAAVGRTYGVAQGFELVEFHPAQASQRWDTLQAGG